MSLKINHNTVSKKFYFFLNQIKFEFQEKKTLKNQKIICRKKITQKNERIFMDFRNTKISEISKISNETDCDLTLFIRLIIENLFNVKFFFKFFFFYFFS